MSNKEPPSLTHPVADETRNTSSTYRAGGRGPFVMRIFRRFGRLLWYSTKKIAYIAFIVAVAVLILIGLDKLSELALKKSYLAHVYPDNFGLARRDLTRPVSHYDYDLT